MTISLRDILTPTVTCFSVLSRCFASARLPQLSHQISLAITIFGAKHSFIIISNGRICAKPPACTPKRCACPTNHKERCTSNDERNRWSSRPTSSCSRHSTKRSDTHNDRWLCHDHRPNPRPGGVLRCQPHHHQPGRPDRALCHLSRRCLARVRLDP